MSSSKEEEEPLGPPSFPPKSCGNFSCLCWRNGIKKFCVQKNRCMNCFNYDCIRRTQGHQLKCSKRNNDEEIEEEKFDAAKFKQTLNDLKEQIDSETITMAEISMIMKELNDIKEKYKL